MTVIDVNSPNKAEEFNNMIRNGYTIVFYYMDGCGHCEAMKDEWSKFENKLESDNSDYDVNVARVNMVALNDVEGPNDIYGFPTIYVLKDGEKVKEHDGERTISAFESTLDEVEIDKKRGKKNNKKQKGGRRLHKSKSKTRKHKSRRHKTRKVRKRQNSKRHNIKHRNTKRQSRKN